MNKGKIVLYKNKIEVRLEGKTIWLTQKQIAELFGVNRPAVVKHINNIYKTEELNKKSTCSILEQVAADGKVRKMNLYNLDMIISVGYRVNSKRATQFRVWATNVLRNYIIKGYAVNQKRLQEGKLKELEQAINLLQRVIQKKQLKQPEAVGLLNVITDYANSWILLQKYDEGKLQIKTTKKGKYILEYDAAIKAIVELKANLIKKKQASELFGQERDKALDGILGSIKQSFGGKPVYPSIEEKASHLLYFIIKDHPFTDGNKRIGCFLFILYLLRNNYLFNKKGERKFNDNALVALALLIAESDPKEKDVMVKLVMNFLR